MTDSSTTPDVIERARAVIADLGELPLPGRGATFERWQRLAGVGVEDVSVVRIVEGHYDAVAILAELGADPLDGGLAGVWAARPGELVAERTRRGWTLSGEKPFCSGSVLLDTALVTAVSEDGPRLFRIDAHAPRVVARSWTPLGMAATRSETLCFDEMGVPDHDEVGKPGDYVDRPGFGHGGSGVAACWWGGVAGLVPALAAAATDGSDDRVRILGSIVLALEQSAALLHTTADRIDRSPADRDGAVSWAATARSSVAATARLVLASAAAVLGTSALAGDAAVGQRMADLTMYLTQYRDDELIDGGRRVIESGELRLC
ncbi:acyl-CoA dehydrogenase [Desertimonas flava]|uniref:acyl-CoA dehydrogenase n=1 Tax=Desertimonas flava TaxID=2064846 RepID=UPI000E354DBA|nr:acyl-CoA dehydrogenase [Desertimonas flava]